MTDYAIWIVSPPGYEHSRCFFDQAMPMQAAFGQLGMEVPVVTAPYQGRVNIVMGGHLLAEIWGLADSGLSIPPDMDLVLYNLEQVAPDVPWLTPQYRALLRHYPVWDYSLANIAELAKDGIVARHLPVAYDESMRYGEPGAPVWSVYNEPPVDVLHFGSMNDRRYRVLRELEQRGLSVRQMFGIYGPERDAVIASARLVVNISYYESKIFNITRCGMLFANSIPVVSEMGPGSEEFHATGGFAGYDGLADKCREVLANPTPVGQRGFELYSRVKLVDCLREVIG